jgi:hypothetical protein
MRFICSDCSMSSYANRLPARTGDYERFYWYIQGVMQRIVNIGNTGSLILPLIWTSDGVPKEFGALLVISRIPNSEFFNMAVINTNVGIDGGLDYHPMAVHPGDGSMYHACMIELKGIPRNRINNSAFW